MNPNKKKAFISVGIILIILISYLITPIYIVFDVLNVPLDYDVDNSDWIEPDLAEMASMQDEFEYYLNEYHLPMNYTLSILWNEDYSEILTYIVTGDACIWTGMMLAAQAFRYGAARNSGNVSEMDKALSMVRKVLSGVTLLLAVPNGGIGPEYGGILARSVLSPDENRSLYHQYLFGSSKDIFNGSGIYKQWQWVGYPSIDQHSGIVFGLTRVALSVAPFDETISETTKLLTQQLVEHYLKTNWMITDAGGRTTGQDIDISTEEGSFAVLSFLKMAQLANPKSDRYQSLYNHYAYERGYIFYLKPPIPLKYLNYYNYYSLNLYMLLFYHLAEAEEDKFLKNVYQRFFLNNFYKVFKSSRNAWYNCAYLGIMGNKDADIARDIADQLMRFGLEDEPGHTRIPDRGGGRTPIPADQYGTEPLIRWRAFIENNTFGRFFYGWVDGILPNLDEILNAPKTTDQYQQEDFIWQRTPWTPGYHWNHEEYRQDSGLSYLLPYYMGIYYSVWEDLE
ncbi:MAG: hypothetical protein GF364_15255 [Candidatus Lokiarchaeota archaeon]|nr:hypothetical protein [Candidatus Lokiarchaeota archaeon]